MGVSSGRIPIMCDEVCNPLARYLPPFQLACRPMPQPVGQSAGLENPVDWQRFTVHKLLTRIGAVLKLPCRSCFGAKQTLVCSTMCEKLLCCRGPAYSV